MTDPGRLQTFTFQIFLFFALASLISVRERRAFWWSRPSMPLGLALAAIAVVGSLIGFFGVSDLAHLPIADSALIFAWAAVRCLGPNDAVKTWLCKRALRAQSAVVTRTPGDAAADPSETKPKHARACRSSHQRDGSR